MRYRAPEEVSPSPSSSGVFLLKLSASGSTVKESLIFFSGTLIILIILVALVILWMYLKSETLQKMMNSTKSFSKKFSAVLSFSSANLRSVSHFDHLTLKKATGYFHPMNEIGKGGFGPVYKGMLDDGRMIAVKQMSLGKSKQGESQFRAEVRLITNIQHKNLVRLTGYCSEGAERLLVYEYMKNGSLDTIIYGESMMILSWCARFQIILGVARGLQYLHEESNLKIVHRDIKAANILLDDNFQPKISDFGMARFFGADDQASLSSVAGTLGYTAPEYAIKGELSEKADIYSFGVLTLEIISCRKNTDLTQPPEMQYLPEYAWKLHERLRLIDLVDPNLRPDVFAVREILRACRVALLCLQPKPELRPPMSEIVSMLAYKSKQVMAPIRPVFFDRGLRRINTTASVSSARAYCSTPIRSESLSIPRTEMSSSTS